MAVLANPRHEQFAQALARGLSAKVAYKTAGYGHKGARQNGARLKARPDIGSRVRELRSTEAAGVIGIEISDRNARVRALNDGWTQLGSDLDTLLAARARDMASVPGGRSGLLYKDLRNGKEIYRIDPGVIAVHAELRAVERQAAQELGQWAHRPKQGGTTVDIIAILEQGRERARQQSLREKAMRNQASVKDVPEDLREASLQPEGLAGGASETLPSREGEKVADEGQARSVLSPRREQFALALARGESATGAYVSAGYRPKWARQNASRMMRQPEMAARLQQLKSSITANVLKLDISDRNARIAAVKNRSNRLRAALDCLRSERARDLADVSGGQSGLLSRDYSGKNGGQEIYSIDTGMIALERELRAHDRQVAQELGQWQETLEDRQRGASHEALLQQLERGRERARRGALEYRARRAEEAGTARAPMVQSRAADGSGPSVLQPPE